MCVWAVWVCFLFATLGLNLIELAAELHLFSRPKQDQNGGSGLVCRSWPREELLKPEGVLIPAKAKIFGQLVEASLVSVSSWLFSCQ